MKTGQNLSFLANPRHCFQDFEGLSSARARILRVFLSPSGVLRACTNANQRALCELKLDFTLGTKHNVNTDVENMHG